MANKQVIRLTESDLRKIIKESVNKVLNEAADRFDPSDWTTNEYGEPTVWQYGDNDNEYYNWRKSEAEVKEAEELKQDILSGKYDDDILYDINRLNRCVDFSSSHLNDDIFDVIYERRAKLLKMGIKKSNKERSNFNNDEIKDLIIQLTQNPIGWSISSDGSRWSNTIITDKYKITRCPSYNAEGEESKGVNGSFIRFPANTDIIYLHIGMDPNEDRNVETGCTYRIMKRNN
jgi:hypothetical protein